MTTTNPTTHAIELDDGRRLAVDELGPSDGPVVLLLHSSPGSRAFDPEPEATVAAGVRLLTVDRPGYGGSSPLEGTAPSEAGVADDVAAALSALGVHDVVVAGWSAGGRYALALAARHPQLVRRVALLGTPARHEDVPWLPPEQAEMIPVMQDDPAAAVTRLQQIFGGLAADQAGRRELLAEGSVDRQQLEADPGLRARVDRMLEVAFEQGFAGVATDIVATAVVAPGYDVAAVGAPVDLWYGRQDEVVSVAHGRFWQEQLAAATLHEVPGTGHLVAATEWPDVLEALLGEEG